MKRIFIKLIDKLIRKSGAVKTTPKETAKVVELMKKYKRWAKNGR